MYENKKNLNNLENGEYSFDVEQVKTLKEAKDILSSLNLKINVVNGCISVNTTYDVGMLTKYISSNKDVETEDIKDDNDVETNIIKNDVAEDSNSDVNEIHIKIHGKGINRLTKHESGKEMYEEQIKDKLSNTRKNVIIMPDNIEDMSILFAQGLLEEMVRGISREYFMKNFEVKGPSLIVNKIYLAINHFIF